MVSGFEMLTTFGTIIFPYSSLGLVFCHEVKSHLTFNMTMPHNFIWIPVVITREANTASVVRHVIVDN